MDYPDEHRRIFAFVTAFLMTAVLPLSGFFIVAHIERKCTDENCPVYVELQECTITIRLITETAGTGAIITLAYIITQKLSPSYQIGPYLCPVSLASLKTRLDS